MNISSLCLFKCHLFFHTLPHLTLGNVYNMATSAKWKDVLLFAGGKLNEKRLAYL